MTQPTSTSERVDRAERRKSSAEGDDAAGLGRARAVGFVAPALFLIGVFLVFPALWTLYLGVTDYRLTGIAAAEPQFVGLDNYFDALTDARFRNSLYVTLVFVLCSAVVGQSVIGFTVAWFMRNVRKGVKALVETLLLLAWIIPGSVVAFLWIALLDRGNGTLNGLLGTPGTAWLLDYPLVCIVVFNAWRGAAFSMLLFSSALATVPPSQLETSRLAGAGGWAQIRDVVFPNIRGHVLTNTLLISLWTFNDFTPYLITAGGPNHESEILPVYIYQVAINSGGLGLGAAVSLIMIVVNLVIALVYLRLLRRRPA